MRTFHRDADWEDVWAEYDRRAFRPPAAPVACDPEPSRRRKAKRLLLLALTLSLPVSPARLATSEASPGGTEREALLSLSPIEAELPPITISIDRLAAESAAAACWVLQLHPQGGACEDTVAMR